MDTDKIRLRQCLSLFHGEQGMIKFTFTDKDSGRVHLAMGLSRGNINRIVAGKPVLFSLPQINVEKVDGNIMIYFGETEDDLLQQMAEVVGPEAVAEALDRAKPLDVREGQHRKKI